MKLRAEGLSRLSNLLRLSGLFRLSGQSGLSRLFRLSSRLVCFVYLEQGDVVD